VQLALSTGIAVREWEQEDDVTIATALQLLTDRAERD
jgi:hypothetical protein